MNTIYISFGPDCHAAGNLRFLGVRKTSLPFDWLLTDELRGIEYVNSLIRSNFEYFVADLKLIGSKTVISTHYPYAKFVHHNLLKNTMTPIGDCYEGGKDLVANFKTRCNRFMDIINNANNRPIFLYKISFNTYNNVEVFNKIISDINIFVNEVMPKHSKCKYRLIVYISVNDIQLYNSLDLSDLNVGLENVNFEKYYMNKSIHPHYGSTDAFKKLLETYE